MAALLLSLWGPLATGLAVVSSHSTTQLADFIRRSVELVALFVSWWVFRHLERQKLGGGAGRDRPGRSTFAPRPQRQGRKPPWTVAWSALRTMGNRAGLERMAGLSVAAAMGCSGLVMLAVATSRFSTFEPGGNVYPGLAIAGLGLLTNAWFWRRYSVMTREHYSPIIAAQRQLYNAKAFVDLCVLVALAAVAIGPAHPATRYVDILGSVAVAFYLLWSVVRTLRTSSGAPAGFR